MYTNVVESASEGVIRQAQMKFETKIQGACTDKFIKQVDMLYLGELFITSSNQISDVHSSGWIMK